MSDQSIAFHQTDEGVDEILSALALLFPGDTTEACVRTDRLTPRDVRRAYDCRIRELHPRSADALADGDLRAREQRFHDLTAAYCRLLTYLRGMGRFPVQMREVAGAAVASTRFPVPAEATAESPLVIAVAGAQEAVGATFVAGTLAAAFAAAGHRTLAVDLDGSGIPLAQWLSAARRPEPLERLLEDPEFGHAAAADTAVPRLALLGGSDDAADARLLGSHSRRRLMQALRACGRRFVVLDLGRADNLGHLDLFASADVRIVVTTPRPEALASAHGLLDKMARRLLARYRSARLAAASGEALLFDEFLGRVQWDESAERSPRWLLSRLLQTRPATCREVSAMIRAHDVYLVANHHGARPATTALLGFVAHAKNELDITVTDVHPIPADKRIYAALRYDEPSLASAADGRAARAIYRCAQALFFPETPDADEIIRRRLRDGITETAAPAPEIHVPDIPRAARLEL